MAEPWGSWYIETSKRPNPAVGDVLKSGFVPGRERALDLGAGGMADAKYLLAQGFKSVTAVDESKDAEKYVVNGIDFRCMPAQHFRGDQNAYDFAISCSMLFHLSDKEDVLRVIGNTFLALRPGGVFFFNILGPDDQYFVPEKIRMDPEELEEACKMFSSCQILIRRGLATTPKGRQLFSHQFLVAAIK